MKKVLLSSIILFLVLTNGCTQTNTKNHADTENRFNYPDGKDFISTTEEFSKSEDEKAAEKRIQEILAKVNNTKPCQDIKRVHQCFYILGYCNHISAVPYLSNVYPDSIECIRLAENKEYVYIVYKVDYEGTNYWVYSFYKWQVSGNYQGDSILFANDDKELSKILTYTMDDLLDIDKEFVGGLTSSD